MYLADFILKVTSRRPQSLFSPFLSFGLAPFLLFLLSRFAPSLLLFLALTTRAFVVVLQRECLVTPRAYRQVFLLHTPGFGGGVADRTIDVN
jgi:hypothetical protein